MGVRPPKTAAAAPSASVPIASVNRARFEDSLRPEARQARVGICAFAA